MKPVFVVTGSKGETEMKRFASWFAVAVCTLVLGVVVTGNASAQTVEKSFFVLTEPLDVGGTILQPGDYQIKVIPLQSNRNLLQVTGADKTKIYATLLSIPHAEGPGGVKVPESRYLYYPPVNGHIRALRTWFAADTPTLGGHDVVYPRLRAIELAAAIKEPVVAVPDEVKEAEYTTAPLLVVTPEKEVKPYVEVTASKPVAPKDSVTAVTPPVPEPAPKPVVVAENRPHHKRLPGTASDVPLIAGLGLLSVLSALGLFALGRRLA
jgi:hypothetical protein